MVKIIKDTKPEDLTYWPAECCANCFEASPTAGGDGAFCQVRPDVNVEPFWVCAYFRRAFIGMTEKEGKALDLHSIKTKVRTILEKVQTDNPATEEDEKNKWFILFKDTMKKIYAECKA